MGAADECLCREVGMSAIRKKAIDGLSVGDVLSVTRTFHEEDTMRFGEITRDSNPVHYDDRFAAGKGLNGRVCHGLLVAGIITQIGGQIGWFASGINFRFLQPVYFGDTITCTVKITSVDGKGRAGAEASYSNQKGMVVMTADMFGILPDRDERTIMRAILEAEGSDISGEE
jgi:3-hydroxybutyryl-CoA dehydratase